MLSMKDINKYKDYTLSAFPAMEGRLAVRSFDPTSSLQANIEHLATDVAQQMPNARNAFAVISLGDSIFQAANKGRVIDDCLRTVPRLVVIRDGDATPKTNYFYQTQYSSSFDNQAIFNDLAREGHEDNLMLPENFGQVAKIFSLGHDFALAQRIGDSEQYRPDAAMECIRDVFGMACALRLEGMRAAPSLKFIQAIREANDKPSAAMMNDCLKPGSKFYEAIHDAGSAMKYAENQALKLGYKF